MNSLKSSCIVKIKFIENHLQYIFAGYLVVGMRRLNFDFGSRFGACLPTLSKSIALLPNHGN
jgi:hypothetical protein